jgi:hypothetical protein
MNDSDVRTTLPSSCSAVFVFAIACAASPAHDASEPPALPAPSTTVAPAPPAPPETAAPASSGEAPPAPSASAPAPSPPRDEACRVGRKRGKGSLDDVIATRACKVEQPQWDENYDAHGLSFHADPTRLSVQRGAHADLFVQIRAKHDAMLQLEVGCLDDAVTTSVHDAQGKRIDETGGSVAMLCMREVLQVHLDAGDEVGISVPFVARKFRWVQTSRSDAGPLPAGSFELRLTLPVALGKKRDQLVLALPLEVTR